MEPTKTLQQAGAQTATWLVTGYIFPLLFTIDDWNQLPPGKLKTFLTSKYVVGVTVNGSEFLMQAFAKAGGFVQTTGTPLALDVPNGGIFLVDGPEGSLQYPTLVVQHNSEYDSSIIVTVGVSYSVEE